MPVETCGGKRACTCASMAAAADTDMAEGLRQVRNYDSQLDLGARQNAIIDCLISPQCFSVRSQFEQQMGHFYWAMHYLVLVLPKNFNPDSGALSPTKNTYL